MTIGSRVRTARRWKAPQLLLPAVAATANKMAAGLTHLTTTIRRANSSTGLTRNIISNSNSSPQPPPPLKRATRQTKPAAAAPAMRSRKGCSIRCRCRPQRHPAVPWAAKRGRHRRPKEGRPGPPHVGQDLRCRWEGFLSIISYKKVLKFLLKIRFMSFFYIYFSRMQGRFTSRYVMYVWQQESTVLIVVNAPAPSAFLLTNKSLIKKNFRMHHEPTRIPIPNL